MPAMTNNELREDPLWTRFRAGDQEAFSCIYREYTGCLLQYGARYCVHPEKLQDMLHDLFIELWNSRQTISPTDCIKFYLCKSLKYKLIRGNQVHKTSSEKLRSLFTSLPHSEDTVEQHIIETETTDSRAVLLQDMIKKLSRRQQEIILLRFYMGFSNTQIAELMQMKYQSVSNLQYAALCKIKESLKATPAFRLIEALYMMF